MAADILSSYIKKLNHPLKEIRERSLQLLLAKLRLGWELDDELSRTRELLQALLAWFHVHEPSLQREALELLLTTIKSPAGRYIVKEFGMSSVLSNLNKARNKMKPDAQSLYEDVIETLKFINTVDSEDSVAVPRLTLPDVTSSESEDGSSRGYYNPGNGQSSKETSISNGDYDINKYENYTADSIKLLLFPWVELCQSDRKTLRLVEDALKLLKSTRRCCRFIRDVFLRDFPPEIFLNRPEIIKCLLAISESDNGRRPVEALLVLLSITRALRKRILQLSSLDLIHDAHKTSDEQRETDEGLNLELEEIVGGGRGSPLDDNLAALRQLPAPIFALETMHAVLTSMARSVVLVEPGSAEFLDVKDLNVCLCLIDALLELLLDCVHESFWSSDHSSKTYRDVSHKSCMVMRLLGDLLVKYRNSFSEDPERVHHRVAWLRLVMCTERMLRWAQDSALPPSAIVTAIQIAQLDPSIELFYPDLSGKIESVLQNTRITVDQEYKSKYRELKKLFISMDDAVQFMKNKSIRNTKKVLTNIKSSLPVLELFQSESYLIEISDILLMKVKDLGLDESDWCIARGIALSLMAHNVEWVKATFYKLLADMVKSVLVGDDTSSNDERCLTLLFDVGILTEICCHGLSCSSKEVSESSSDIMLYLLRGRLVLSETSWWRLLASLLPVLPLLHVYAEHDTLLGKAICKSLHPDIAECMGVSRAEITSGLVRLLFVRCVAVQLEAAHTLCRVIHDERYLPPKETLRVDVLLSALRRVKPQDFNIDASSSPSKSAQSTGLNQILDVLKQDIMLDEHGSEYVTRSSIRPTLEPSLRRSTLQQLAVMIRQQELHDTFMQYDGLKVIVATLRMSLMVEDYLAFPECAISCVSILNSVCFASRHALSKINDLPVLLIRVILVFPSNDSTVTMASQVLATIAWAGFTLQELDSSRHRVPALPLNVTERTSLPFMVHSYWKTSPNAQHSYVEWLLSDEDWRAAIRVRWWCAHSGRTRILHDGPPTAPLPLRPTPRDVAGLKASCPIFSCTKALLALENSTSHRQVSEALNTLESYVYLMPLSCTSKKEFGALPWHHMRRFLWAPPASSRDATLLCSILNFVVVYMDNVPTDEGTMAWIKSTILGNDGSVISLLSRDRIFPQQTVQDSIDVTQLNIHIVKVLLRCIVIFEREDDYKFPKIETLLKILLACLEKVDLKNFHMLGYLNELMRCIRYALNSRYCKLSEDTLLLCLRVVAKTLFGCASGAGRKGQACRLDAVLSLLALLRQIREEAIPVSRWSEGFSSEAVHAIVNCVRAARVELRASAILVAAELASYAQMIPHLLQATQEQSISQYASRIFAQRGEANVVRAAASCLLAVIASRASPRSDILECDVLEQLKQNNFLERCLENLIEFCNAKEYTQIIEPNISLSLLESLSELEVRATKGATLSISAHRTNRGGAPPTASLVAAVADVLHNVSAFNRCPVQEWNEQGLYRLLFRCASWSRGSIQEVNKVRAASCRALVYASSRKCVRVTLAATKDCLHDLLQTLTPLHEEEFDKGCLESRAQAVTLLARLLGERSAGASVWRHLKDGHATQLLHLLLQCLEIDEIELQDASIYCLTQLAQSTNSRRHPDKTKDETCIELFDSVKSPYWGADRSARQGAGDSARSDCQPEYLCEEICKLLIGTYQKLSTDNRQHSGDDDRWVRLCACLSSVLSVSPRCRRYAVHRNLPNVLLAGLQSVRDYLSVLGKPVDVIRNSNNNPVLRTLVWLLTIMDCCMIECVAAKESLANGDLATTLCRLWPWCMLTDELRLAVMHLLHTFNNDCSKAWSSMCVCVMGRTLVGEVCALTAREAAMQTRPRPEALLLLCIHTLRRQLENHHCRTILLKSDVLTSLYKLCSRERVRGPSEASLAWTRLCEVCARHSDGASAILALASSCPLNALPMLTRARMLPAIAHAARLQRAACLHSPDLLELLTGSLLAGDTAEVVSAARAVWALASNNHKAKLLLRSAGVSSAVHSCLQRMQRCPDDPATQRALQLLTYTNSVLAT